MDDEYEIASPDADYLLEFSFTDLEWLGNYTIQVSCTNNLNETSDPETASAQLLPTSPPAPTELILETSSGTINQNKLTASFKTSINTGSGAASGAATALTNLTSCEVTATKFGEVGPEEEVLEFVGPTVDTVVGPIDFQTLEYGTKYTISAVCLAVYGNINASEPLVVASSALTQQITIPLATPPSPPTNVNLTVVDTDKLKLTFKTSASAGSANADSVPFESILTMCEAQLYEIGAANAFRTHSWSQPGLDVELTRTFVNLPKNVEYLALVICASDARSEYMVTSVPVSATEFIPDDTEPAGGAGDALLPPPTLVTLETLGATSNGLGLSFKTSGNAGNGDGISQCVAELYETSDTTEYFQGLPDGNVTPPTPVSSITFDNPDVDATLTHTFENLDWNTMYTVFVTCINDAEPQEESNPEAVTASTPIQPVYPPPPPPTQENNSPETTAPPPVEGGAHAITSAIASVAVVAGVFFL